MQNNDKASYDIWTKRLLDPSIIMDERLGLLHGGSRFFNSRDQKVCSAAIHLYLTIANRFSEKCLVLVNEEERDKAKSVLAQLFSVSNRGEWPYWGYFSGEVMNELIAFICCSFHLSAGSVKFFERNYCYLDSAIAERVGHRQADYAISGLLESLLCIVLRKYHSECEVPSQQIMKYRREIIREAFVRAPWKLLLYEVREEDVLFLESISGSFPEEYPRDLSWRHGRIQGLPYQCLTTRSETLAVLKFRLSVSSRA